MLQRRYLERFGRLGASLPLPVKYSTVSTKVINIGTHLSQTNREALKISLLYHVDTRHSMRDLCDCLLNPSHA